MAGSGYRSSAWYPILAVGVSMMGFISIKTGRDVVFFNQGGLRDLPLVYMLVAMVSVMGAMIHLQAIKRWGARRVRSGVFLSMALLFFCFVPFVDLHHKTAMLALFALVPAAFAALFATAWLLAGDLLEEADEDVVRWAYTRIGAGSMIGGIAGGVLAGGLSLILAPRFLVAVGAVILLVAAGIVSQAHRKHPIPGRELRPSPSTDSESGWQKQRSRLAPGQIPAVLGLMKQRYILGLIGISGLGALAALYIDFQFYAVATLTGHADAQFFASFYTVLNLAALALQLLATPWIQSRYGVGGALLVLPMALLGGAGAIMLSTTVLSRAILRVTEGGVKASIHRSIWEQVFLPIGRQTRDMAKVIVDGLFARMSEGVGALGLYLWLSRIPVLDADLNLSWISWIIAAAVALWILLAGYLAKGRCSRIDDADPLIRLPDS